MALPIPTPDAATTRYTLLYGGKARVCHPRRQTGALALPLEPAEDPTGAGAFYYRYGPPKGLLFTGNDYLFLRSVEESSGRCQPLGLRIETRPHPYAAYQHEGQFIFSCNECAWDHDLATCTPNLREDSAYRLFTENYDRQFNLLALPDIGDTARITVSAELATLAVGIKIEFKRIDQTEEADLDPNENWVAWLRNTSHISDTSGGTTERTVILFRYRLQGVPMIAPTAPATLYRPVDKSATGWLPLPASENSSVVPHLIDYVKQPQIAGFRTYTIRSYNDWLDPTQAGLPAFLGQRARYGDQLLLLPCGDTPSVWGYSDTDYLRITGPGGGQSLGGAQNDDHAPCLNVRRNVGYDNIKSLWWKFGQVKMSRGIKLLECVKFLAQQTAASYGGTTLVPPTTAMLSDFFSAPVNQATAETGAANELPRLLLSAASDVKRYGASEPATRLLVSLKTLLSDLSVLYDCGWWLTDAGALRIEHRTYLEASHTAGAEEDLTIVPAAILPAAYDYRTVQLPRYEELGIIGAATENVRATPPVYFGPARIDYGINACVNTREGQNTATRNTALVATDVTNLILSGDTVPDTALVLLAPDADNRLTAANIQAAASELIARYWRRGRAFAYATIEGPAPPVILAIGVAPITGPALQVDSVRPSRAQRDCTAQRCTLRGLGATTRLKTNIGQNGQVGKASLNLDTGIVTYTPWMPTPAYTATAPTLPTRDFDEPFTEKFS
jgi:hypothetical protein